MTSQFDALSQLFEPRLTREELAYAGGLFEGEGSLILSQVGRPHRGAIATINMTDIEPLERFTLAVGVGKVVGPYQYQAHHKPLYRWRACTFEEVQAVVAMLWPWLGPRRRKRAKEVLAGDNTPRRQPAKPKERHPRDYSNTLASRMFGRPVRNLTREEKNEYQRAVYRLRKGGDSDITV